MPDRTSEARQEKESPVSPAQEMAAQAPANTKASAADGSTAEYAVQAESELPVKTAPSAEPSQQTENAAAAPDADLAAREAALAAREAELAAAEQRFAEKQAAVANGERPAIDLLRGDPDEKNAKEKLYDKIPLTVHQLDVIIGVCVVLFFLVILLGMNHGALLARLGL